MGVRYKSMSIEILFLDIEYFCSNKTELKTEKPNFVFTRSKITSFKLTRILTKNVIDLEAVGISIAYFSLPQLNFAFSFQEW